MMGGGVLQIIQPPQPIISGYGPVSIRHERSTANSQLPKKLLCWRAVSNQIYQFYCCLSTCKSTDKCAWFKIVSEK